MADEDIIAESGFILFFEHFMQVISDVIELLWPEEQHIILRFSVIPLCPQFKFVFGYDGSLLAAKEDRGDWAPLFFFVADFWSGGVVLVIVLF